MLEHRKSGVSDRSGCYLGRPVPLNWLAGHGSDAIEVVVAVEQCQSLQLSGGGNHEIYGACTAVLLLHSQGFLDLPGTIVGTIGGRHPDEQCPYVFDAFGAVSS